MHGDAPKYAAIVVLALASAGCMINPRYLPDQYSFTVMADRTRYDFALSIYSGKFEELGGPESPKLDALINTEVRKAGICPKGYVVADHGYIQGGYRSIVGKCKSSA